MHTTTLIDSFHIFNLHGRCYASCSSCTIRDGAVHKQIYHPGELDSDEEDEDSRGKGKRTRVRFQDQSGDALEVHLSARTITGSHMHDCT
jgi:hypothetical protein